MHVTDFKLSWTCTLLNRSMQKHSKATTYKKSVATNDRSAVEIMSSFCFGIKGINSGTAELSISGKLKLVTQVSLNYVIKVNIMFKLWPIDNFHLWCSVVTFPYVFPLNWAQVQVNPGVRSPQPIFVIAKNELVRSSRHLLRYWWVWICEDISSVHSLWKLVIEVFPFFSTLLLKPHRTWGQFLFWVKASCL